jgi:hypothetical protein
MPKTLGKLYLKARARNPVLLEQIQYTTNWRVHRLLRELRATNVRDLNTADFARKCAGQGFVSLRARAVRELICLPLLGPAVMKLMRFYIRVTERGTAILACPQIADPETRAAA